MSRPSRAIKELSPSAQSELKRLGEDIAIAIKTRETYVSFAERVGVTRTTLRKILQGDPNIPLGMLVAVLDALGLLDHLREVARPENDHLGQSLRLHRSEPDVGPRMNTDF